MKNYTPNLKSSPNLGREVQRSSRPTTQGSAKPNTSRNPNPNFIPPASVKKTDT